jgi:hypothetical protein
MKMVLSQLLKSAKFAKRVSVQHVNAPHASVVHAIPANAVVTVAIHTVSHIVVAEQF